MFYPLLKYLLIISFLDFQIRLFCDTSIVTNLLQNIWPCSSFVRGLNMKNSLVLIDASKACLENELWKQIFRKILHCIIMMLNI